MATPSQMLETLKLLTVAGAPNGKKLAAFPCSGGDAAMVADGGSLLGLEFPGLGIHPLALDGKLDVHRNHPSGHG